MPKIKSHSGAKKRFKKTGAGKWKAKRSGLRHLLAGTSSSYHRQKRRPLTLRKVEEKILDNLLPYA